MAHFMMMYFMNACFLWFTAIGCRAGKIITEKEKYFFVERDSLANHGV